MRKGIDNSPLGNGRKPFLPPLIESALVEEMGSYINLVCAEMEKQPKQKDMIDKLSCCLVNDPMFLRDYQSLYKRMYKCLQMKSKLSAVIPRLKNGGLYGLRTTILILGLIL